jgi:hypothetical protein
MARRDFDMISSNSLEVLESPIALLPGMEPVFTVKIAGDGVIASPTMTLYRGTKDVSVTNLTGSMSVEERAITCKKIVTLTPGDWVFYVSFTDGGVLTQRFCRLIVGKVGA